jgi:arginine utilization regulatory protein
MNEQVTKVKKHLIRLENLNLPKTFTAILDLLDECIFIVDKNGHFVFYNKANEKLDKLKRGFVIGRHLTECFKLNERTSITLNVLSEQMPILDTFQDYTAASGHHIISVSSSYPLFNNKELIGALTITKDITRFKKLMYIIDKEPAEELLANGTGAYYTFDHIIGQSSLLTESIKIAQKASKTASPILLYGETGTGKELFAQSIHNESGVPGPFIPLNCATIPENLLEGILFGTAKGAFTGSVERPGLFEEASNGTLFLDELCSMNLDQQSKLLRFLETGRFRRVGESKERIVRTRIISALNISPIDAIEQGLLRQDLFFRLGVMPIKIPSLVERREDIPLLIEYFIDYYNKAFKLNVQGVSTEVMRVFSEHDWPGNIRELRHLIEHAMNLVQDEVIEKEHLPCLFFERLKADSLKKVDQIGDNTVKEIDGQDLKSYVESVEKEAILKVLKESEGNINDSARKLGISRQNLDYKIKKYGLISTS